MNELLIRCDRNLKDLPCCHSREHICNCSACLQKGFYGMPDKYDCEKKLNYYVINYGPSYTSEIYYYLSASKILENFLGYKDLKILSLGCGFAPDLIAIEKYINDNKLDIQFRYCGVDQSDQWGSARYSSANSRFMMKDVSQEINHFGEYDLIFILKLFSTLYKNGLGDAFLQTLSNAITSQMKNDAIIIFNDINTNSMGRDDFHRKIRTLLKNYRQFYCGDPPYKCSTWIQIPQKNLTFSIPKKLSIRPLMEIRNTIFFEYRK